MPERQDPAFLTAQEHRRSFEETAKRFPHSVKIKAVKIAGGGRLKMRRWFHDHNLRVYQLSGDSADVLWNTKWNQFYFKSNEHALQFALTWS